MCRAFSCLVTQSGKVYWQLGLDSHDRVWEKYRDEDKELEDITLPARNKLFAHVEVVPTNNNYLNPNGWKVKIDEAEPVSWWRPKHEILAEAARKKWYKQIEKNVNMKEARKPIHPFDLKPPKNITQTHLALLHEWVSVRASVRDSVWSSVRDSVWSSVRDSVRDSVWSSVRDSVWSSVWVSVWSSVRDSVRDSVGDSVWDSVWAYGGSLFPRVKNWKYIDRSKPPFNKIKGYPFQSAVKLWKQGLVPSFDGQVWRIHGHKDARVLWTGTIK